MVQSQVLEAKVFHSPYGTGIAIVTGSSRFTLATNIDELKLRRLPEVPGKAPFFLIYSLIFFTVVFHISSPDPSICLSVLRVAGEAVLLGSPHTRQTDQSAPVQWT